MLIQLYGGPGSGKSATAAGIYHELRKRGLSVELVQEHIKYWAYQGRRCRSYDQVFIFGNQLHAEDFLFQQGVNVVVTDSPLMLQCMYGELQGLPVWQELLSITQKVLLERRSLHIFLDRSNIPYEQKGRYETPAQARAVDERLEQFLRKHLQSPLVVRSALDWNGVLGCVFKELGIDG